MFVWLIHKNVQYVTQILLIFGKTVFLNVKSLAAMCERYLSLIQNVEYKIFL